MCGIFGFAGNRYTDSGADLVSMKNSILHRGPDHFDYQLIDAGNDLCINFGHVRLAIIDTSNAGNQPMTSKTGRYTIIFNGEIYNFLDIKAEIISAVPNIVWNSTSDTEVLLAGIELFGLEACVQRLVGMFAFALWDNNTNELTMVRDRIGEKPLYYGYQGGQLIFASELKAFEAHPKFENELNEEAAIGFLHRSVVPQSFSIYKNIHKVIPGSILKFTIADILNQSRPNPVIYWSLKDKVHTIEKFTGTYAEAKDKLEALLIKAVKNQAISDVPLGAFLSGGIDSSLVCSILKKHEKSDLRTYTIAMPEPGINESEHAAKVALAIGTDHKVKTLDTKEIISRMDEIIGHWDEPFADSSQIPTFFVSELARKEVTVSLSGDGADEFTFGYTDYPIYKKFGKLAFLGSLGLDRFFNSFNIGTAKKIANLMVLLKILNSSKRLNEAHARWRDKFRSTQLPVKKDLFKYSKAFLEPKDLGFDYAGYYDARAYLPDDILVKVDRAAMAVSLESRAPFLDHTILEFLISLPEEFKFKDGVSKRILKDILYDYVPKEIIDRPKQGFSIPLTYWLRNDLKEWSWSIINEIPENSVFWDKQQIIKLWNAHQHHKEDHTEKIWNILILERFFKKKNLLSK